ncbi:MAG: leucyl aminopeptidase [Phycisphaerae bacterium]
MPLFWAERGRSSLPPGLSLEGVRTPEKLGDCVVVGKPAGGFETVTVVSMGLREECTAERLRCVGGAVAGAMASRKLSSAAVDVREVTAVCPDEGAHALCEGLTLGSFRFDRHKTDAGRPVKLRVTLATGRASKKLSTQVGRASLVAAATNYARELSHEPANVINPVTLAARARSMAKSAGLKCRIIDHRQMQRLKMGAFLAVGQGSVSPPRLIVLEYGGRGGGGGKCVVLVGKAVTFDTGGYSLKDKDSIVGMKYDKCGGTAVLGVMQAVAALKIKGPVVGLVAAAENMVAGNAYRPNDIIRSMSGKTIEIISTDAEGRLVLADTLTFAQKHYKPRAIIDVATLTGGVVVALGKTLAGLFCDNNGLRDQLLESGKRTFERLWPMPMHDEYFELLRSDDCDFKNSGSRGAHSSQGAVFLKQFVDERIPWAHLDIAGVASVDKAGPYCPKGGTGFGVRLLCDYLERL